MTPEWRHVLPISIKNWDARDTSSRVYCTVLKVEPERCRLKEAIKLLHRFLDFLTWTLEKCPFYSPTSPNIFLCKQCIVSEITLFGAYVSKISCCCLGKRRSFPNSNVKNVTFSLYGYFEIFLFHFLFDMGLSKSVLGPFLRSSRKLS